MKVLLRTALAIVLVLPVLAADKQIHLIAGPPSHGPLAHEQNAAVLLLSKHLNQTKGVHSIPHKNGWPEDSSVLDKADAIFFFFDGSTKHPVFQGDRATTIAQAAKRGVGLMFYHYAVEPPPGIGYREMLDWIGGYFEPNYSVNPIWEANFAALPKHPITRGVAPFQLRDEWYFNMRFGPANKKVTPILVATPPPGLTEKDGIRSGNADVRAKAGQPQTMMWAFERADGGRGVGFTGGHYHLNLGDNNFRKLVLNALVWSAKAEVPQTGVGSAVTQADLMENLDPKTK